MLYRGLVLDPFVHQGGGVEAGGGELGREGDFGMGRPALKGREAVAPSGFDCLWVTARSTVGKSGVR